MLKFENNQFLFVKNLDITKKRVKFTLSITITTKNFDKMNKSQLFKFAHKLTKEILSHNEGNYQATFGECLKSLYAQIEQNKNIMVFQIKKQIERNPNIFTKTVEEYLEDRFYSNKFLVENAYHPIRKKMQHVIEANEARIEGERKYYKKTGGAVTMC